MEEEKLMISKFATPNSWIWFLLMHTECCSSKAMDVLGIWGMGMTKSMGPSFDT